MPTPQAENPKIRPNAQKNLSKIMILGGFHPGRENKNQPSYFFCRRASCHSSWINAGVSHPRLDKEPQGGDKAQQHIPHRALCSLGCASSSTQSILPAAIHHGVTIIRAASSFPALLLAPKRISLSSLMH